MGHQTGLQWLTGYLVEKALSVDNLFVFLLIFSYFKVLAQYQHRVLFWGVLGRYCGACSYWRGRRCWATTSN